MPDRHKAADSRVQFAVPANWEASGVWVFTQLVSLNKNDLYLLF